MQNNQTSQDQFEQIYSMFQGMLSKNEIAESPIKPKRGRPKSNFKDVASQSQKGTHPGETRATFIVNEKLLEKIKAIAHWDRLLIKDVITIALEEYIAKHEGGEDVVIKNSFKGLRKKSIEFFNELKKTFGIDKKILRNDEKVSDIAWKYKVSDVASQLKEFNKRGLVDVHYVDNKDTHGSIRVSHFYIRDQGQQLTTYNIPVSNLLFTA